MNHRDFFFFISKKAVLVGLNSWCGLRTVEADLPYALPQAFQPTALAVWRANYDSLHSASPQPSLTSSSPLTFPSWLSHSFSSHCLDDYISISFNRHLGSL
jgi:hypothetical protein